MTRAPYVMAKPDAAFDRGEPRAVRHDARLALRQPALAAIYYPYSMGETAENVAERWEVDRERQDAFALASQQRAVAAIEARPVRRPDRPGRRSRSGRATRSSSTRDEHPRADTSAEALAKLRPAFRDGGTVTAGNAPGSTTARRRCCSSRRSGPASSACAARPRRLDGGRGRRPGDHGHRPRARHAQGARRGPGSRVADLDLVELNEAFASAVDRLHRRARARPRPGQRQRRGDRAGPPARDERRAG